jgi:hypothetical protein
MSQRNSVSIILPISDAAEQRQAHALRSLLTQSHRNFELIIPGLPGESTEALLAGFRDSRLKFLPLESKDAALAMQTALAAATGTFVAVADAAATYQRHRLELQLRYFERYPETDVLFAPLAHQGATYAVPGIHDPLMLRFLMLFRPLGTEGGLMFRRRTALDKGVSVEGLFHQRNSLAYGVLPALVGATEHKLPFEVLQAPWATEAVEAQYGAEAAALARELRAPDAHCTWNKVLILEQKLRQWAQHLESHDMAYAASFRKALSTALCLYIEDAGLRGWLRQRPLYSAYFRAAIPWKSKWRTALF